MVEITGKIVDAITYELSENMAQYLWDDVVTGFGVRIPNCKLWTKYELVHKDSLFFCQLFKV